MELTTNFPLPARGLLSRSFRIFEKVSAHPLLLIGVHGLCLAAVDFPYWQWIVPFVLGVTFFSRNRVVSISLLNIVFFALTGGLLSVTSPAIDSEIQYWQGPMNTVILSGALIAAIYFGLFHLMLRQKIFRRPVLIGLTLIALLGFTAVMLRDVRIFNSIALAGFFAMIRVFWPMCYQLSEVDSLRTRRFYEHLGTLAFPWQFGWASPNIVRGYSDLTNAAASSEQDFRKIQISGVKLMLFALVTQVLAQQFSDLVFSKLENGDLVVSPLSQWLGVDISTWNYLQLGMPPFAGWIFVFASSIYFLLMFSAITNAAVSIARMCGFMVFREVYQPLQATSFNAFLGRMYYYYIAILLRFFFYPLWQMLRPVRVRKARIFLAHFLTILIGGFLTTGLRSLPFTVYESFLPLADLVAFRWPYFVALALLSGVTAILPAWSLLGRFRGVWYFTLFTVCYALQIRYFDSPLSETCRAFQHLFGI